MSDTDRKATFQSAQEAAFNAGRERERADVLAWLATGENFEHVIQMIREGAHEGHGDD